MNWSWKQFWLHFNSLTDEYKTLALQELNKNDWLASLPSEIQIEVMDDAPEEILKSLGHFPTIFKQETIRRIGK